MMHSLTGIATRPPYVPQRPIQDAAYLRFLRKFPCVVCLSKRNIEAAHTGAHGVGQKSCDYSCIPLCKEHHRDGVDSYHSLGPVCFEFHHKLDLPTLLQFFQAAYKRLSEVNR